MSASAVAARGTDTDTDSGGFWEDIAGDRTLGTWFGLNQTLHGVWDEQLINAVVQRSFGGNSSKWSEELVNRTQLYRGQWAEWISCADSVVSSPYRACTDVWITESNRLCMEHVYRYNASGPSFNYTTGFTIDAASHYFEFNLPVVEHQLIRAGVRLAEVFNRLFTADTREAHTAQSGRNTVASSPGLFGRIRSQLGLAGRA